MPIAGPECPQTELTTATSSSQREVTVRCGQSPADSRAESRGREKVKGGGVATCGQGPPESTPEAAGSFQLREPEGTKDRRPARGEGPATSRASRGTGGAVGLRAVTLAPRLGPRPLNERAAAPGARGTGRGPSCSQPRAQHSGPGKQKPPPPCPVGRASDHQGPATCPVTKPRITI